MVRVNRIRGIAIALTLAASPSGAEDSPFGQDTTAAASAPPFRAEVIAPHGTVSAGGETALRVALRVPPEHYVYAERTRLEILPAAGLEVLRIDAPAPKLKHDPFLDEDVQVFDHDVEFLATLRQATPGMVVAVVHSHGCSMQFCYFPTSDTLRVAPAAGSARGAGAAGAGPAVDGNAAPATPESQRLAAAARRGIFWLLLLAFGAGVATSFTPCVYPMIPITIGIIGARSAGRRSKGFTLSLLYVLGIAVTYSALGTTAALTGSLFGGVLQNAWVVAGVALVFLVMAMSLFGAFELQVPSRFASRAQSVQGSGYPGAFLLGLVAGIVASPCIGPVLVAMLAYVATTGSAALGFALFFTFALGLGLLFIVLGTFTGVLASLPKSGGWMTGVRIAFGILFLGLALYYLHPLLPHGRNLVPFGLALVGAGLVLGGLRAIDEAEPAARRWRKAVGRVALAAGLYAAVVPWFAGRESSPSVPGPAWMDSESAGRARAAAESKPLLVDFSAEWCVACKKLEHYTFSDPRVIELSKQFVPVRVDATTQSPEITTLMNRYGILGLPWVAFVRPDGTIQRDLTVTGFVDADVLLDRMRRALPKAAAPAAP